MWVMHGKESCAVNACVACIADEVTRSPGVDGRGLPAYAGISQTAQGRIVWWAGGEVHK